MGESRKIRVTLTRNLPPAVGDVHLPVRPGRFSDSVSRRGLIDVQVKTSIIAPTFGGPIF
jgi:hypothetical protein